MENEIEDQQMLPRQTVKDTVSSLLRTLVSLGLFIAVDYMLFKSWEAVFLLVAVIFIHEMGHFIAMKSFGYKGVNMTFVPFVGAYVSGEATDFSKSKKIIMLLAGPVPGIIIGSVLFYLYQQNFEQYYWWASLTFLSLNLFNMLPVSPLDGGQIFETLFFSGNRIIQLLFLGASFFLIVFLAINFKLWLLLLIALLLLFRIFSVNATYRIRKILDTNNIDYRCSYDDLTDEQYWQIRDVLVKENKLLGQHYRVGVHSEDETKLIGNVKNILAPYYDKELTGMQIILFVLVWLITFSVPVLQWLDYRGYFS